MDNISKYARIHLAIFVVMALVIFLTVPNHNATVQSPMAGHTTEGQGDGAQGTATEPTGLIESGENEKEGAPSPEIVSLAAVLYLDMVLGAFIARAFLFYDCFNMNLYFLVQDLLLFIAAIHKLGLSLV